MSKTIQVHSQSGDKTRFPKVRFSKRESVLGCACEVCEAIRAYWAGQNAIMFPPVQDPNWVARRSAAPSFLSTNPQPPISQVDDSEVKTLRRFGVEIECVVSSPRSVIERALREEGLCARDEGYNHNRREYWKITTDGSIQVTNEDWGKVTSEVVSPPLTSLDDIPKVCRALAQCGAHTNKTCGLHVHIDADGLVLEQFRRILKLYALFEPMIDSFMPLSRRGNSASFCQSMRSASAAGFKGIWKALDEAKSIEQMSQLYQGRYYKVNINAFWQHGTIEIRHHSGTINENKICNWVLFLDAFMERATNLDLPMLPFEWGGDVNSMLIEIVSAVHRRDQEMQAFTQVPVTTMAGAFIAGDDEDEPELVSDIESCVREVAWGNEFTLKGVMKYMKGSGLIYDEKDVRKLYWKYKGMAVVADRAKIKPNTRSGVGGIRSFYLDRIGELSA